MINFFLVSQLHYIDQLEEWSNLHSSNASRFLFVFYLRWKEEKVEEGDNTKTREEKQLGHINESTWCTRRDVYVADNVGS